MKAFLRRVIADDRGQDLAEYGIALTIVVLVGVASVLAIAGDVQTLWTTASTQVALVVGAGN